MTPSKSISMRTPRHTAGVRVIRLEKGISGDADRNATLDGLVAGLAHEINTPLGVGLTASTSLEELASAFSAALEEGSLSDEARREFLSDIAEHSRLISRNLLRAAELIREFKLISSDEAHLDRREFPVAEYVNEIVLSLTPHIQSGAHRVTVDCDPVLRVVTRSGAFSQILSNLLLNALNHGLRGRWGGEIRVKVTGDKDSLELIVEDNGNGMDPSTLERIYDPYFTTARQRGGTGLGLFIVNNVVTRQFGGTLDCSSAPGKGTRFTVTLNLKDS